MSANKNDKQIMDVTKPGKSVPSSTSKPVIVGHKSMVQDPMVTAEAPTEVAVPVVGTTVNEPAKSPSISKKVISPISEEDVTPTPSASDESQITSSDIEASQTTDKAAAVVDVIIDQVETKAPPTSDEDIKNHEHIEKLINDKKYNVPLGKMNGKKGHKMFSTLIFLIILVAFVLVLLDADVINLGFTLPFDFI